MFQSSSMIQIVPARAPCGRGSRRRYGSHPFIASALDVGSSNPTGISGIFPRRSKKSCRSYDTSMGSTSGRPWRPPYSLGRQVESGQRAEVEKEEAEDAESLPPQESHTLTPGDSAQDRTPPPATPPATAYSRDPGVTCSETRWPSLSTTIVTGSPIFSASMA
jgi:hypothetical protein